MNFQKTRLLAISFLFIVFGLSGCGKKSTTSLAYRPHVVPLEFKCTRQGDGRWAVSGGLATPYGIFAVEQTFDTREDFTYLVLRDRAKGTDQVFKLASKGYVELHTVGEHKTRVQQEDNKVVVDVETISGTFDVKVFPDSQIMAKVELGAGQPDFAFSNDKRMVVQYRSYIWSDDSLPLDSIQSVTYRKGFRDRTLVFNWKPGIQDRPKPLEVSLSDWPNAEKNFQALQQAAHQFAPQVQFKQLHAKEAATALVQSLLISALGMFIIIGVLRYRRGKPRSGFVTFGLVCGLICFLLNTIVSLVMMALDMEAIRAVFV